jgi:hypothetical protein
MVSSFFHCVAAEAARKYYPPFHLTRQPKLSENQAFS